MTAATRGWRGVWADLTGVSDRWGRTILYGVIFARLSIIPILAALAFALALGPESSDPLDGFSGRIDEVDGFRVVSSVVIAPLIETLLLAFIVWLTATKLRWPGWAAVLAVVAAIVPLHGLVLASLLVAPFFALMAAIQLNWFRKGDGLGGFWVVATLHALANASSLLTSWLL